MAFFYISCGYLIWGALVFISCGMQLERGRNSLLWDFVTFFLTPIVSIAFLSFLGETEEVKRERRWQEKIKKISEDQHEELRKDFKKLNDYFQKCYS